MNNADPGQLNWSDLPRPHALAQLVERGGIEETFAVPATARVIAADHDALLRDYPDLPTCADGAPDGPAIDTWLLDRAAVVSRAQLAANDVNSAIRTRPAAVRRGVRFPGHGRAAFIACETPTRLAILSIKGVGVGPDRTPSLAPQSNGLLPAHCALYEYLMHKLVERAFRHVGAPHRVVPAYAVIDCGFDECIPEGGRYPAGLLVRQGHLRPVGGDLWPTGSFVQRQSADIEFILRQFGITSGFTSPWLFINDDGHVVRADRDIGAVAPAVAAQLADLLTSSGSAAFDVINVQCTDHIDWAGGGLELVDLHYGVRRRFEHALVSTVNDRILGIGAVLPRCEVDGIQPRSGLSRWIPHFLSAEISGDVLQAWGIPPGTEPSGGFAHCFDQVDRARRLNRTEPQFADTLVAKYAASWTA